jgi:hypothetical protein
MDPESSVRHESSIEGCRCCVERLLNVLLLDGVEMGRMGKYRLFCQSVREPQRLRQLTNRLPSNPLTLAFPWTGSRINMLDECPFSESLKCFCLLPR